MQLVRIVKRIGLIGLVAASLLLCTSQSFEPAPKLYRAKPEDVPPWFKRAKLKDALYAAVRRSEAALVH